MQLSKKMGSGGGEKSTAKSTLFKDMKIKGSVTQQKQKPVVHSQTSFNIVSKKEELVKQQPVRQTQDFDRPAPSTENFKRKTERRASESVNDQKASKQQQKQKAIKRQKDQLVIQKKSSGISTKNYSQDIDKQQSVVYDSNDAVTEKSQKSVPEKRLNPLLAQLKKTVPKQQKQQKEEKKQQIQRPTQDKPASKKQKTEKQTINQQLAKIHLKHIQLFQRQKKAKQKIIQLHSQLQIMKQEVTLNTTKQCAAVQKEEYDLADKLQSQIQIITPKIAQLELQKKKTQDLLHQLQYDELSQLKTSWGENKRLVRKIKMVELQIAEEISFLERDQGEKIQQEKSRNQNEKKKLAKLNSDIKSQSQQLAEYTKKVTEDKNFRIQPLQDQRITLEASKQSLERQIRQLQAQLKAKKNNLSQAVQALKQINTEIQQIQDSFVQQEAQLQKRKVKLRDLQSQSQQFENRVRITQNKIEQQIRKLQEQTRGLNKEVQLISLVAKDIELKSLTIQDTIQQRRVKLDNFIHNQKALHSFEQIHKHSKQKVKELQFTKANILAQVGKYQDRKKQIKSKIPTLESQQKSMATAKNFKAAALKKNELKQLQQQMDDIAKKIEANFVDQKRIEQQISEIQRQQQKYLDQENQIKKNLAISQYKFAVEKKQAITQQLNWLQNSKIQNRKALIQLLNSELQQLNLELDYIGEQYQLTDHKKDRSQQRIQQVNSGEDKLPRTQIHEESESEKQKRQKIKQGSKNEEVREQKEQASQQTKREQYAVAEDQSIKLEDAEQKRLNHNQLQYKEEKSSQEQDGYVPLQID